MFMIGTFRPLDMIHIAFNYSTLPIIAQRSKFSILDSIIASVIDKACFLL